MLGSNVPYLQKLKNAGKKGSKSVRAIVNDKSQNNFEYAGHFTFKKNEMLFYSMPLLVSLLLYSYFFIRSFVC